MAELTNPLFEDEKEFLERQKLEYERALLGDVEEIKEKTQQVGKYVAIGASVLGGVWLLSKAFGSKKPKHELAEPRRGRRALRKPLRPEASLPTGDDLGFGSFQHHADRGQQPIHERADIAPDVYHASASGADDPFQPVGPEASLTAAGPYATHSDEASSILASTFRAFLQSDTGKMLVAQATAVLMAVVAKKLSEYLPVIKNPDLASSPAEPETRDIDFTYHHDDANAPHQPL
ncbi:hypothetical protein [Hymenobacter psychrotolerans]|uniref:Uncharacterized protein n=1 Tax=Hymenobacter psychrotolerans DSM 18569 TaxID=1121959 RepID=A0A1M6Q2Y5_9BACT|nr:hypothetical protein [Hymenobacter psychrotolerans]SHK14592.1 hypothetical protein SAMN02746009_00433 [Hymenobacter psychrotolerans DSM 18569]